MKSSDEKSSVPLQLQVGFCLLLCQSFHFCPASSTACVFHYWLLLLKTVFLPLTSWSQWGERRVDNKCDQKRAHLLRWACLPSQTNRLHSSSSINPTYTDISRLKTIKNILPESVRYSDIKMTIAILMVKTGFVRPKKSSMEGLISPPAHSSTSRVSTI